MSLYRQPSSDHWYVDIRNGGRRIRRSTHTADKKEAQKIHDELAARAWKIRAHGKVLADALLAWYTAKPRKGSSQRALRQIRAEYADRPLDQVTEESIVAVFGAKAPGTYNKLAAILRAAMNIAKDKGWVAAAPKISRRQEPTVEPVYLTAEQWRKLRAELPPHLVPLADFSIATGLRWSNAAGLTWERVSLATKQAWIPAGKAKAGKTIPVPLSAAALRALRAVAGPREGFVFLYHGQPIGSPKTAFLKACVRAGLGRFEYGTDADGKRTQHYAGFTWHGFRHTWASWHAMAGTPLDVLQKLGAWETREMVERYGHLAPSYVSRFAGNAVPLKAQNGKRKAA